MMSSDEHHYGPHAPQARVAHRAYAHTRNAQRGNDPHCHVTNNMQEVYSLETLQMIVGRKLERPCPLAALAFLSMAEGTESVRALAQGMHVSRYCVNKHERDIRMTLIPMLRVAAREQTVPREKHCTD